MKNVICLDFDGVIHAYSKRWHDGTIYDKPVEGAIQGIIDLQKEGMEIAIHTARPQLSKVYEWLLEHGLPKDNLDKIEITNTKPQATVYVDDRGLRFTNWMDLKNYFI